MSYLGNGHKHFTLSCLQFLLIFHIGSGFTDLFVTWNHTSFSKRTVRTIWKLCSQCSGYLALVQLCLYSNSLFLYAFERNICHQPYWHQLLMMNVVLKMLRGFFFLVQVVLHRSVVFTSKLSCFTVYMFIVTKVFLKCYLCYSHVPPVWRLQLPTLCL